MPQRFFLKTGKRHELISATFFMIITGANSAGSIKRVPDRLEKRERMFFLARAYKV